MQSDFDEGFLFPNDKNNGGGVAESKTYNNMVRLPGPPQPPMKDAPPAQQQSSPIVSQRAKLGLGKFGRLGAGPSKLKK